MTRIPRPRFIAFVLATLALSACVTVNIYFPAAEVEKTADEIVSDVYGKNGDKNGEASEPTSSLGTVLLAALEYIGPRAAHAQDALSVQNATIRGLKQEIAKHHQQLTPFYDNGAVGITSDGYLEVRDTGGMAVPQVAQLKRLVAADNQARKRLYQEVAKALDVDPSQIDKVEQIFAKNWIEKAGSGWWVQQGGSWTKK
jgi:uncharacterized protein YdbL (DUF1318 family)